MKVLYHDDNDGRACAYAVQKLVVECHNAHFKPGESVEFLPMQYNIPFDAGSVEDDEYVYMLDFSLPVERFDEVLQVTPNITWIDHHESAMYKYVEVCKKHGERFTTLGVQRVGVGACVLTWLYFSPHYMLQLRRIDDNIDHGLNPHLGLNVPQAFKLISDRDVWRFDYPDTPLFYAGSMCYDTHPLSDFWREVTEPPFANPRVEEVIDAGVNVDSYRERACSEAEAVNGFDVYLLAESGAQLRARALNTYPTSSESFGPSDFSEYDILMPFYFTTDGFVCSMYSQTVDVSKLAVGLGGGGHTYAAGFTTKVFPFVRDAAGAWVVDESSIREAAGLGGG